jgi:hypothetical protein
MCINMMSQNNIFDVLSTKDSVTGNVIIHQDKRIEELLVQKVVTTNKENSTSVPGYRVQVFSGSDLKTSKTEAYNVENQIKEIFPNQPIYVNYTSPSWKVRIGDFATKSEAQSFQVEFIKAFPSMRSEVYIVKEQILIQAKQ